MEHWFKWVNLYQASKYMVKVNFEHISHLVLEFLLLTFLLPCNYWLGSNCFSPSTTVGSKALLGY